MSNNKLVFVQNKEFDGNEKTIVLVHGMDSCKETFTSVIESEKLLKFNIFAVDLHGHGETPIQNDIYNKTNGAGFTHFCSRKQNSSILFDWTFHGSKSLYFLRGDSPRDCKRFNY
jgi:pimeloyl-ACP methyl ester carboxylesterase